MSPRIAAVAPAAIGPEWKGAVTRRKEVVTTGLRFENGMRPWGSSGLADSFSMAVTSAASDFGSPDTTIPSQVLTSETTICDFRRLLVPATMASSCAGLKPRTASIGDVLPSDTLRMDWQRVPCQKR
jgi:hypothetical protein